MQIGPLSHYCKICLYDNCMITVQNSNSHLASHTVAPQITGFCKLQWPNVFFCSCGMEKNSCITKRIRPTAEKGQEAFRFIRWQCKRMEISEVPIFSPIRDSNTENCRQFSKAGRNWYRQWLKWGGQRELSPRLLPFEPPAIWATHDWIYKVLFYA